MALDRQLVAIPVDNGLDTKPDEKQQPLGFLRKAENFVYETIKLLKKRFGYSKLEFRDGTDALISNPVALSKYKNELVCFTDTKLYSYSTTRDRWVSRGNLTQATASTKSVIKNAATQSQMDSLVVENFQVVVWKDSALGVRYSVRDLSGDSFLISDGAVGAGERPQLANIGGVVYIVYGDAANVKYRSFSILQPETLVAAITVASNRDTTTGLIDAHPCGTKLFVAYNSTVAGDELALFSIDSTGVASSVLNITGQAASNALHVTCDSTGRILLAYSNGVYIRYLAYAFTLSAQILAPTVIEVVANVSNCSIVELSAGVYTVYYEVSVGGIGNNYVKSAGLTIGGTVSSIAVFTRSVGLAGRAFSYDSAVYIPVVFDSTIQSTYFLLKSTGQIITKWSNQVAAGLIDFGVVPNVSPINDSSFLISSLFKNRIQTDGNDFFSTAGVQSTIIEFLPENVYSNAQLADSLHICAGVLRIYDGSTVSEDGFHVYPETVTFSSTAGAGGFMSDGTYNYVAVYRWTDNTGKDHLSVPTPTALEVVVSGGGSTQIVTVTVPTLRLTEKSNVVIDLYRTETAGTVFYKVSTSSAPTFNDKTVDTVSIVDTLSDATLASREALYTTGNILENVAPPAAYQIAVLNNRLALVGDDKYRVFFSKEISEGRPVEYTDIIYRDVDPIGGELTAIRAMQDKLILFSNDASFYIVGDGPNNAGEQDNFTKPEILSTDIGCIDPDSLVLTPNGLDFKSRKGIWQVGGNLSLNYVGARVEEFNDQTVTSAQVVGELNQIRYTLDTDRTLVYNYNVDRWGTFENHGAKSSVVVGNDYYYIREDDEIWKEDRQSFSDAGSPISSKLETGWMQLTEIQGFQRVYKIMLLGAYKSSHKLKVRISYDYVDAWVQEDLIDPVNFITSTTYGESSPYGSESPYGGDGSLYQVRIDLARQKCQAIKISIEDVLAAPGQSFELSAMTIQVGAKTGVNKLPSTNVSGTN